MRFQTLTGKLVYKNLNPYRVDWDKPCRSKFQKLVKDFFRDYWHNYICFEEMPMVGTRLRFDLVNATKKIIIESNGSQHDEFNPFFHKTRMNYFFSIQRDQRKREWAEKNGFELVEILESDLPKLSVEFFKNEYGVYII